MKTLYKENEIENLEKVIGGGVLNRNEDISFVMTTLNAVFRQVGLNEYCTLTGEEYGDNFKITLEIFNEVQND